MREAVLLVAVRSRLQKYSAIDICKHSRLNMKSHPIFPNTPLIYFPSLETMICIRESLRFDITRHIPYMLFSRTSPPMHSHAEGV